MIFEEIEKQQELSTWVDAISRREYCTEDRRHLISMSCFDLVIEHHASIILLCNSMHYGSMFALYRVIFESLVRGMYFLNSASEDTIDKYEKGSIDIPIGTLISEIESSLQLSSKPLSLLKNSSYSIMCDFTHTGYRHLIRRNADGATGYMNYPELRINATYGSILSSGYERQQKVSDRGPQ